MKLLTLAALGFLCLGGSTVRAADRCGAHQHVSVEKDEDEGGTVKRCVCDEGWDADGPGAPCRKAKAEKSGKSKAKK